MHQEDIDGIDAVIDCPSAPAPWPGVVVPHEAGGLNRDMRRIVTHLSSRAVDDLAGILTVHTSRGGS